MSNENYTRNKAAIDQFRKELMEMVGDIQEIDTKVLNQAVNEGRTYAVRHTLVGVHKNPVEFTVKNGKYAGKKVSFFVQVPGVGGKLREGWSKKRTRKTAGGLETELVNPVEYASWWNYGHRIITKKGGPVKGFQPGTHLLEKSVAYVEKRLVKLFDKAVREVQEKHDK